MKKVMAKIIIAVLLLTVIVPFVSCNKKNETNTYSVHTELQESYLNDSYQFFSKYARGSKELSYPKPISLNISEEYLNNDPILYIGEKNDLSDAKKYKIFSSDVEIYNLKIATTYYYQIKSDAHSSEIMSFKVDDKGPRNIYVDGITNFRDVGGWKTSNGKYVNQGLLYRSSKFNEDESTTSLITQKGIDTIINDLKIKTEIDLRMTSNNENGGITSSVIDESVNYISLPFKSGGNYLKLNEDKLPKLFEILSDESNYPIVFHCSIGTDRTGVVSFLINALLGVSEEDLYRDYLFSNFGKIGSMRTTSTISDYIEAINMVEGNTFSQKSFNYLKLKGVSEDNINKVIEIMTR